MSCCAEVLVDERVTRGTRLIAAFTFLKRTMREKSVTMRARSTRPSGCCELEDEQSSNTGADACVPRLLPRDPLFALVVAVKKGYILPAGRRRPSRAGSSSRALEPWVHREQFHTALGPARPSPGKLRGELRPAGSAGRQKRSGARNR